jgi:hypothetical protein
VDYIPAIRVRAGVLEAVEEFAGLRDKATPWNHVTESVEEVMLIFDSFPSGDAAKKFAAHVKEKFDRESSIAWSMNHRTRG